MSECSKAHLHCMSNPDQNLKFAFMCIIVKYPLGLEKCGLELTKYFPLALIVKRFFESRIHVCPVVRYISEYLLVYLLGGHGCFHRKCSYGT